jgi:hypothetical protein
MKRLCFAMALIIMFLVGCITAHVASELVIPPAKAGTNPTKWEYVCHRHEGGNLATKLTEASNQAGSQGWEMVSASYGIGAMGDPAPLKSEKVVSGSIVCFKRPLP